MLSVTTKQLSLWFGYKVNVSTISTLRTVVLVNDGIYFNSSTTMMVTRRNVKPHFVCDICCQTSLAYGTAPTNWKMNVDCGIRVTVSLCTIYAARLSKGNLVLTQWDMEEYSPGNIMHALRVFRSSLCRDRRSSYQWELRCSLIRIQYHDVVGDWRRLGWADVSSCT